jgi:hypothetical protein
MKFIFYIPEAELIYISEDKYPCGVLNKLRRDMYKYLRHIVQRPRNIELINDLMKYGGISHMKFVMTERIPFLAKIDKKFYSYKDNEEIKRWLQMFPGRSVKPINTKEEYDLMTTNRHAWDNWSDMYP